MGQDMYIVNYKNANIPRNYEFYDALDNEFMSCDTNGNIYIEEDRLNEWLEENPELKERFKEELEILRNLLKKHGSCIELCRC